MNAWTFLDSNSLNQQNYAVSLGRAVAPSRRSSQPRFAVKRSSRSTTWLEPSAQDRLLRQRSLSEARQGNYLEALAGFTILIDRNPNNATDYNNRGLVHFQWGQREAAIADYNTAIRLNPRLASAYNNRANYYAAQGLLTDAIADYDQAVDLDPTNLRAWLNQGITFRDLGWYAQAIENFEHALQLQAFMSMHCDDGVLLKAHIYAARGRTHHLAGDWNYAMSDYRRALDHMIDCEHVDQRLSVQIQNWMQALTNP